MITPNIRFFARLEYDEASQKTPKYKITQEAGFYAPMESLKGRNGFISFYLSEKLKDGSNVPSMRLQAKGSLNFTGLKEYFEYGKISGFAYGYPLDTPTYSSKKTNNPFYDYRSDGYLFIVDNEKTITRSDGSIIPSYMELLVLEGTKILIASYCKQLMMGGFDDELRVLREQAKQVNYPL